MRPTVPKAFLDMDGVLVDFVGGMCRAHGRPNPYRLIANCGQFDLEPLFGMDADTFWTPARDVGFWRDLEKTPDCDEIVSLVTSAFGEDNVAILTAPSADQYCVPGKRQWIAKHFPALRRHMIFGGAKQFLAGPTKVLVDDRDVNIDAFNAAGGFGILLPCRWNRDWIMADSAMAMEVLRDSLDYFFKEGDA